MKSKHVLSIILIAATGAVLPLAAHTGHDDETLRHWETASMDPDRIVLTFTGDPATEMGVTWRTSTTISNGVAQIAPAGDHPRFDLDRVSVEAVTEELDLNQAFRNSQGVVHYHSATFKGLTPDTLYAYRVGDGGEHWSEWIHFRTASRDAEPFTFLYFGDAQNNVLSHWSRVIRAAYQAAPDARLAVHAGDLINRAHADREWAEWFKAGGWIHGSWGSFVVVGNHEYDPLTDDRNEPRQVALQWRPQFNLPVETSLPEILHETVYYMDYQGVRFIGLNSMREPQAQAEWLEEVLAENPNRWTVVTFHHPVFSSGGTRDNPEWRDLIKPILDAHAVDLVLQGHDHTYARGQTPVRMTNGDESAAGGRITSLYVNSVSGPKMYEFRENGWDIYRPYGVELERMAENTQFFQVIEVNHNTLDYRAITATGKVYDAFQIQKNDEGEKTLINALNTTRRFDNTPEYLLD